MSSGDGKDHQVSDYQPRLGIFGAGLLIGGLAGAVSMLVTAPQSGERTRRQMRRKALELRDQIADNAEEAREQVEESLDEALKNVRKVRQGALSRVDDAQQRGQIFLEQQSGRVKE